MTAHSQPNKLPGTTAARIIHLRDFNQLSPCFSNWQGRFEQLSQGRFEGTLRVVHGEIVRVVSIKGNQRVLLQGRDAAGLFSVHPVIPGNATSVWQGHRLTPGQLVILGADAEANHCSGRQTEHHSVSLRPEVLDDAARILLNSDGTTLPRSWAVHLPPPEAYASLNDQLTSLLNTGIANPSFLGTVEGRQFEQECVRSLVAALFSTAPPQPRLSLPSRSHVIRRAEEFMRATLTSPLGAIDLCRELGVSDRTLRLAFRERYTLGPMAHYKCLRLNAVRSRLIADPAVAVADAAREFGFHHLGNFAAEYLRLFGERPSATPRRLPDDLTTPTGD